MPFMRSEGDDKGQRFWRIHYTILIERYSAGQGFDFAENRRLQPEFDTIAARLESAAWIQMLTG
jgi:hypothetical protein